MQRYFLKLAFNGSRYHGWQRQPNGISVQEVMEEALSVILRQTVSVTGCGRTDTGVHAREFFLHFDLHQPVAEEILNTLTNRLNGFLPADIVVFNTQAVLSDYHARYSAVMRTYRYYITKQKDPFLHGLAWHQSKQLDIHAMQKAATLLPGTADFSCFAKAHRSGSSSVCTIESALWEEREHLLIFTITANRFLRNMVRAVVGTLVDLGRGKISQSDFVRLLHEGNRSDAGESVPAHGLFLEKVSYPFNLC